MSLAVKLVIIQCVITLSVVAVGLVFADLSAAFSAAIGGTINIVATLYMGKKLLTDFTLPAKYLLMRVYVAEFVKLLFIILMLCLVFNYVNIHFSFFITTLSLTSLAYLLLFNQINLNTKR